MKANKFDKNIKQKFENRTFKPSTSAWERLSVQLDEQPKKKKKGWFFYIGVAASILLLVSIGIQVVSEKQEEIIPKNEVVISPNNRNLIDEKIEQLINEIPVQEAIVKSNITKEKEEPAKIITKNKLIKNTELIKVEKQEKNIRIAQVDEKSDYIKKQKSKTNVEKKKELFKSDVKSAIKVNANDLLYAVTHSDKEVKEYYSKYNVSREDILRTIKNELKKSNIKMNPETMLAEIEFTIIDEDFQNNFLKSVKRRVSDLASAFASRNN